MSRILNVQRNSYQYLHPGNHLLEKTMDILQGEKLSAQLV
jgi:hypothetical protein